MPLAPVGHEEISANHMAKGSFPAMPRAWALTHLLCTTCACVLLPGCLGSEDGPSLQGTKPRAAPPRQQLLRLASPV